MSPKWVLLGLVLLFTIGWVASGAQDCPALLERALSRTENACARMRSNQACYGYRTLEAQLQEGLSPFAFNGVGDITGVDTIQSLRLSGLDPTKDEWGVSVMRVRADISDEYPNENVTLLAFGAVSIDPIRDDHYQPMQAFAIQTSETTSGCNNITENGLLIQTPEGIGRVTLWINDVKVRIGSTVLFQAQPGGDLTISTLHGLAQIEAQGVTQEAPAGMRVRVLLNEEMQPIAPPTPPESFDAEATGLMPIVDMVTAFTDGTVQQFFNVGNSNNGNGLGVPGGSDHQGDCNREHGQGRAGGNCYGHDNPNAHNGNSGGNHQSESPSSSLDLEGCNRDHGQGDGSGNCYGHDNPNGSRRGDGND